MKKVTNIDARLELQADLRQDAYFPNIGLATLGFNYVTSGFVLTRIFSFVVATTTCAPKILLKIYESNLFLFIANH